jgi:Carboxypeptidase regulatory-like domain
VRTTFIRKLFLHIGALTLVGYACLAQSRPALPNASRKLEITVTDENGIAVRSAVALLSMASQAKALRCETDFAGHCVFANLPAGTFQLRVEKQGFYAAVLSSVQPQITAAIDVTLSHLQEVQSVVNVNESPSVIDPAQVSSKEEITGIDVIDIPYPATNDYRNVLNFIPGVVQDASGQPHVAGAQTYQTLTLLDGFNVSQPANGLLLVRVSTDAFRSIEVEPSREPAEYGKASGGVLGLNTGIGDDHFHVIATNFIPSLQDKNGIALDQWTPRITLSGPIRTRKMWFFDAIEGEYDNFIITQLPSNADADHFWRAGNLAKVQTNLTSRNILTTTFLFNYLDDQHSGLSPLQPVPTTPNDAETAYVGTVKDQHYFSGGELLESGFNVSQYNLALTPIGTQPYYQTLNAAGGNYYLNAQTNARRWQGLSNLYIPPHYAHGRHDIKLGVDLDRIDYDAQFLRSPISFWPGQTAVTPNGACPTSASGIPITPSPCARYSVFFGGNYSTTYNFESSGYVEDRWQLSNRILVEPGLRFDWDEIVRKPLISPRLAGTYVLDNSGNTKLSAGAGLVYDATDLILIARPYAGERDDYFFNSAGQSTDLSGAVIPTPTAVLSSFTVNRQNLQAPRFFNWSVALEKKLPASLFMKAEFMQRQGTHDFVYNTPNNLPGGNFILQNTRDDRYNAFQITLRRNFGQRYSVMGSYTRSSTHSTQALDFNVDAPILGRVLPGTSTIVSPQAPGPLLWDAPNRFLSWGFLPFFRLPIIHELDLAYSAEARNGFPFNVFTDQQLLYGTPGSYRFPTYFTLNLALEKRFHLFGYYWALRGGFDDITGASNPVVVNADVNSPQFLTFSGYNRRSFTSRIRFLGKN